MKSSLVREIGKLIGDMMTPKAERKKGRTCVWRNSVHERGELDCPLEVRATIS